MNTEELSNSFDLLTNVFKTNYGFGQEDKIAFDEYEKSYFLSLALEAFIIGCYDGKNGSGYEFEITEEDRRMLDSLVKTKEITLIYDITGHDNIKPLVLESVFYELPKELMFITYEQVNFTDKDNACINGAYATVYPVTQDEFWRTYKNPFRGANQRRVLRLDAADNIVELVSKNKISKYTVRFVERPTPIVLVDLPDNISVFGQTTESPCMLDEQVHNKIVEIAVNIALRTKSIGNK